MIDRWQWVILFLVTPFFLFPSPGRSWILLIIPLLWVISWLTNGSPVPLTPLNGVLLIFLSMLLVSVLVTFDLAFSLPKLAGLILGIAVFFAIVRYGKTDRGWWISIGLFLAIGVGLAAFGLFGTRWGAKISLLTPITAQLATHITGLPGIEEGYNPNQLAGGLAWVVPVLVGLSMWSVTHRRFFRQGKPKILVGALVVLALFVGSVLVLTESRSGYLGVGIACAVMLGFALPRRWRWILLGALLVVLPVMLVLVTQSYNLLLLNNGGSDALNAAGAIDTVNGRLEIWSRALYGIQDFPFTGMGLNMFRRVAPVLYPFFLISPDVDIGHAHNEFLQAALDLGIPGLIAFLALYLVACWMLIQVWRSAPLKASDGEKTTRESRESTLLIKTLSLSLGVGLLSHMIFGLTDATALGAKPGILFWMLLGLITALFNRVHSGCPIELPGHLSETTADLQRLTKVSL
jgi:putative inorganic carbon (HCO3(-)) transporter